MAFEVEDYLALLRLLEEHPEWRAELRRLLLTDELLALPQIVRELAEAQRRTEEQLRALVEAQRRTEERVGRVEERVGRLEERVERVEERVGRVEERVGRVEERVGRVEERVERVEERVGRVEVELAALAEAQRHTNEALQALAESQRRLTDTVGDLKGRMLEQTYRDKATAYFGAILRRLQVVNPYELEEALRAHLSEEEFLDLLQLDLLIRGQPRQQPEISELWLAVEVSAVVDQGDVERARRRATLLRRAGYQVIPLVAGERLTQGAEEATREQQVAVLQDGRVFFWEETLRAWIGGA
jgi:archaellum component FlaC